MSRGPKLPRNVVLRYAEVAAEALYPLYDSIDICGSLRRGALESGDVDIVVTSPICTVDLPSVLSSAFDHCVEDMEGQDEALSRPRRCFNVNIEGLPTIPVDVWTVQKERYGAALLYTTGSGPFNVIMRRYALMKGLELKLQGVLRGGEVIASATEEECFAALGWKYLTPYERHNYRDHVQTYLAELKAYDDRRLGNA